jgi:DNA-binding NarL/FixJ family response regulator
MATADTLSVWLIANSPVVREGWVHMIEKAPNLVLRGASSYEEAKTDLTHADCDAAIVELGLCKDSCWELVRFLKERTPDLPILVSSSEDTIKNYEPHQVGADKFVLLSGKNSIQVTRTLESFFEE